MHEENVSLGLKATELVLSSGAIWKLHQGRGKLEVGESLTSMKGIAKSIATRSLEGDCSTQRKFPIQGFCATERACSPWAVVEAWSGGTFCPSSPRPGRSARCTATRSPGKRRAGSNG